MTPTFSEWIKQYELFKESIRPVVSSNLPTEVTELERENQALPRLLSFAHEHEAMAALFYTRAKEGHLMLSQFKWALKDSAGVASTIKARGFAVGAALRRGM